MKTPFIYLFLGAGLLCTVPAAARTLTLEACREAAAEHNRTLQNSRFDLEAGAKTANAVFARFFRKKPGKVCSFRVLGLD